MEGDPGTVRYELTGGVATVRLDRPDVRNALDTTMLCGVAAALDRAADDRQARSAVITGGSGMFASGADIRQLGETRPMELLTSKKDAAWQRIFAFPKPLVAAVAGYALGGGCELALSADIIIAADDAVLGQPEVRLGIMPAAGGTQRWARALGRYRAAVVNLAAEQVSAWDAYAAGIVAEVVPREQVVVAGQEWAHRLSELAPLAVRNAKTAIRAAESLPLSEALRYERTLMAALLATDDAAEGVQAFFEKRAPRFEGS